MPRSGVRPNGVGRVQQDWIVGAVAQGSETAVEAGGSVDTFAPSLAEGEGAESRHLTSPVGTSKSDQWGWLR